jgi:hypothetical protein
MVRRNQYNLVKDKTLMEQSYYKWKDLNLNWLIKLAY